MYKPKKISFDNSWKEILEFFFEPSMAFLFPEAHAEIDWSKGFQFLDQEFRQALEEAKLKKRFVDKLVRAWLKQGKEVWVLIHIEVQSQRKKNFAHRMFLYNTLIYQRHNRPVATLVVLGDKYPNWKPDVFGYNLFGNKMLFQFSTVKLLDYKSRWDLLEKSTNLFAIVVMAHLKTLETYGKAADRAQWKFEICRLMLKKGFSKEIIHRLFIFIEMIMVLPDEIEREFQKQIYSYEDDTIMAKTMLPHEQYFLEQGFEQGILQQIQDCIIQILEERFYVVPNTLKSKIKALNNKENLQALFKDAMKISSLNEFEKAVDEI